MGAEESIAVRGPKKKKGPTMVPKAASKPQEMKSHNYPRRIRGLAGG